MKRREFIALLGGSAVAWPLAARAQQGERIRRIGYLNLGGSPESDASRLTGLRRGLNQTGYVEGQNLLIEYRWAGNQVDRLSTLVADLVQLQVDVIVAVGVPSALAAKAAASSIPIVFAVGADPVQFGLVASLNRPGGNLTGITVLSAEIGAKRLQLLHELVPKAVIVAALVNPTNMNAESLSKDLQAAARNIGLQLHLVQANTERDIEAAFATVLELRAGALLVGTDPFFNSRPDQLVALAARHGVPTIYPYREFVAAGGLMSYGSSLADA